MKIKFIKMHVLVVQTDCPSETFCNIQFEPLFRMNPHEIIGLRFPQQKHNQLGGVGGGVVAFYLDP